MKFRAALILLLSMTTLFSMIGCQGDQTMIIAPIASPSTSTITPVTTALSTIAKTNPLNATSGQVLSTPSGDHLKFTVKLPKNEGFKTQAIDTSRFKFIRMWVWGPGIKDRMWNKKGFMPLNSTLVNLEISGIPRGNNRVVTALAYDANKQLIEGAHLRGYYSSVAAGGVVNIYLKWRYVPLGNAMTRFLEENNPILSALPAATLDYLQASIEAITGTGEGVPFLVHPTLIDTNKVMAAVQEVAQNQPGSFNQLKKAIFSTPVILNDPQGANLSAASTVQIQVDDPASATLSGPANTPLFLSELSTGNWNIIVSLTGPLGSVQETISVNVDEEGRMTLTEGTLANPLVLPPFIRAFSANPILEGSVLTINGENFSTIPGNNTVTINGTPVAVTASTGSSLTMTLPGGLTGQNLATQVSVGGKVSNIANLSIYPPTENIAIDANGLNHTWRLNTVEVPFVAGNRNFNLTVGSTYTINVQTGTIQFRVDPFGAIAVLTNANSVTTSNNNITFKKMTVNVNTNGLNHAWRFYYEEAAAGYVAGNRTLDILADMPQRIREPGGVFVTRVQPNSATNDITLLSGGNSVSVAGNTITFKTANVNVNTNGLNHAWRFYYEEAAAGYVAGTRNLNIWAGVDQRIREPGGVFVAGFNVSETNVITLNSGGNSVSVAGNTITFKTANVNVNTNGLNHAWRFYYEEAVAGYVAGTRNLNIWAGVDQRIREPGGVFVAGFNVSETNVITLNSGGNSVSVAGNTITFKTANVNVNTNGLNHAWRFYYEEAVAGYVAGTRNLNIWAGVNQRIREPDGTFVLEVNVSETNVITLLSGGNSVTVAGNTLTFKKATINVDANGNVFLWRFHQEEAASAYLAGNRSVEVWANIQHRIRQSTGPFLYTVTIDDVTGNVTVISGGATGGVNSLTFP